VLLPAAYPNNRNFVFVLLLRPAIELRSFVEEAGLVPTAIPVLNDVYEFPFVE
jgi:hypothetical protein